MNALATTGAGFLLAVLWFDLMFDVQTRQSGEAALPTDVIASIATYYRRVTTEATPMNRFVSLAMLATLSALVAEIVEGTYPAWLCWSSLALALSAIGLASARTFRNARVLGAGAGSPEHRSALARAIYRDHRYCLAAISLVVALQLAAPRL